MDKVIAASLKLDGKDANQTVKSFKTELKEANESLIQIQHNFGPTSKEALQAARKVAELRDRMQEAREVSDLFDPGAKFQAFGNVVRTVAGGMTALTGTMALFGDESEDVQKALLRVQGALAITEGLNTIFDSAKDFQRLGDVLKTNTVIAAAWNFVQTGSFKVAKQVKEETIKQTIATEEQAVATTASTAATIGASGALKLLRAALIATGIGAIVVGVIALWQNFAEVKKWIEKLTGPLDNITKFFTKLVNKVTDFVGVTSDATRATEKMIRELKKSISDTERFLDLNADKYDQYTQKKIQADLDYRKKKLAFEEDTKLSELQRNSFIKQAEAQRTRIINDASSERAAAQLKIDQDLAEKRKEAEKKRLEEAKKAAEEERKRTLNTSGFDTDTTTFDPEKLKKDQEQRTAIGLSGMFADFNSRMELQSALDLEMGMYRNSEFENQQIELELWYKKKYDLAKKDGLDTTALTEEYEKRKTDLTKAENERRLSLVSNLLGQAAGILGKHTAAGKAMAIAQATIDTYQSANAAYKSMAGIPVVGPGLGVAAAGLAVIAGLKNIREIAKTKVPGGGDGGGAVPSVSADAPLRPQRPVETNTRLPKDQINQIGNATVKAFIVESDVTNNQQRIKQLNRAARLGS